MLWTLTRYNEAPLPAVQTCTFLSQFFKFHHHILPLFRTCTAVFHSFCTPACICHFPPLPFLLHLVQPQLHFKLFRSLFATPPDLHRSSLPLFFSGLILSSLPPSFLYYISYSSLPLISLILSLPLSIPISSLTSSSLSHHLCYLCSREKIDWLI